MIGYHAFCPSSGASLPREIRYDDRGVPKRAPAADDAEIPLTTGRSWSLTTALTRYFRHCHSRHAERNEALYGRASLALTRLKHTTNGRGGRDEIVWYALGERLARTLFGSPLCELAVLSKASDRLVALPLIRPLI